MSVWICCHTILSCLCRKHRVTYKYQKLFNPEKIARKCWTKKTENMHKRIIKLWNSFDSCEREEHLRRLTVTLGLRSLPRRCSGSPKSWERPSDKVGFNVPPRYGRIQAWAVVDPPSLVVWPLWSQPSPDLSWSHSAWHFNVFSKPQQK